MRHPNVSVMELNKEHRKRFKLEPWHRNALLLMVWDVIAVNLSYFVTLWLRFDLHFPSIPANYLNAWLQFTPIYAIICVMVFWALKLYHSLCVLTVLGHAQVERLKA